MGRWLQEPVRVWHLLVAAGVAFIGYIYVGRTGNDMVAVLNLERALRVGLEDALMIRPRTKEFLLAYPALFIGLGLWVGGRRAAAWPWLLQGSVAGISVINTFAHAHSPLAVSALRSAYGLAGGAVVAAVAVLLGFIAMGLPPVRRRRASQGSGEAPGAGTPPGPGTASGAGRAPGAGAAPRAGATSGTGRTAGAGPG